MENLEKLKEPFAPEDIEWRVQQSGEKGSKVWAIVLAYITNRAIMDRLDAVFGPMGWQNEFASGPDGGVVCKISAKDHETGEWISKWDGAPNTDIEAVKGGLSSSMKRAAVQWGIGRYLYNLESNFASVHGGGRYRGRTKNGTNFRWDPPELPSWALPEGYSGEPTFAAETAIPDESEDPAPSGVADADPPRSDSSPAATTKQRNYLKSLYGYHKEKLTESTQEKIRQAIQKENLTINECSGMIDWIVKTYGHKPRGG